MASPSLSMPPSTASPLETKGEKGGEDTEAEATPLPVPEASAARYVGQGTEGSPYIVDWDVGDRENPYNWSKTKKWRITLQLAAGTWCVSFASSAYSAGVPFVQQDLHISKDVATLGISLYVLGFGLGPLVFAPLSEMYGRRLVFMCTYGPYTLLHLGGSLGKNAATLLITRLLAGIAGSSPLTNAGGTIADIWSPRDRGLATSLYSTAPFLGPVIGPIVGGFVSQSEHLRWRFNFWLMLIFAGTMFILGVLFMPESYAPVLLRRRARHLASKSGNNDAYVSKYDLHKSTNLYKAMKANLSRPFLFLFTEPIVSLLAIYISISYAILYALFAAFPIVFQEDRHFSPGLGGLAFAGIGVGIIIGTCLVPIQNRLYWRAMDNSPTGKAPPEARLYMAMSGAILLPISLFWFAWTCEPPVPPIVSIIAGVPFGTGIAQILQSLTGYLLDTYGIYSASAIAATVVLRSVFAAAFPLFSPPMFANLGNHWASSLFAFLSAACMPMPYLFWRYGGWIRSKSRFAVKDDNEELFSSVGTPNHNENEAEKRYRLRHAKRQPTAPHIGP